MAARSPQIALDISLPVRARFDTFVQRGNEEVLHVLQRVASHPEGAVAFLWGRVGGGRSHLLQGLCQAASDGGFPFLYLPLAELMGQPAEILSDLDGPILVALDDVDVIAGQPDWEEALFHLFNRIMTADGGFVCVAASPPPQLAIALPDLRSRLASGIVLQVNDLDDEGLREALHSRAKGVGMNLPDAVVEYLIRRIDRSMPAVVDAIDRIDRTSLAEKNRPSVPLVKRAMEIE